jgi:hypothetical protein
MAATRLSFSIAAVPPISTRIDSRRDPASCQRSVRLPASSAAECEEGFMDLGAPVIARPSSRWKWCSQPKVRSTTQGAPRSEPCSVWRQAICGAVSDHVSTPRTRNRRHRAFSHARRASDCDRLGSSTSSVSQADACWDTTISSVLSTTPGHWRGFGKPT